MKKVSWMAVAMLAICVNAVSLALAQGGSVEQQISSLTDQQIKAQLKNDTSFIEKYYADNATIIHSDGTIWTKAQEIENLKSGTLKYESIDVQNRKVNVYGDTAVVTLLISFKGVLTGKPVSRDVRRTQTWVKQKGNWKTVAYQVTPATAASK